MTFSLKTTRTPEGIRADYEDGSLAGYIHYVPRKDDNQPCSTWRVEPIHAEGDAKSFVSMEAAEFYLLSGAAERKAIERL